MWDLHEVDASDSLSLQINLAPPTASTFFIIIISSKAAK